MRIITINGSYNIELKSMPMRVMCTSGQVRINGVKLRLNKVYYYSTSVTATGEGEVKVF